MILRETCELGMHDTRAGKKPLNHTSPPDHRGFPKFQGHTLGTTLPVDLQRGCGRDYS